MKITIAKDHAVHIVRDQARICQMKHDVLKAGGLPKGWRPSEFATLLAQHLEEAEAFRMAADALEKVR